jgi:hypothetical protein
MTKPLGEWEQAFDKALQIVGVHAVVLHTGKVLYWCFDSRAVACWARTRPIRVLVQQSAVGFLSDLGPGFAGRGSAGQAHWPQLVLRRAVRARGRHDPGRGWPGRSWRHRNLQLPRLVPLRSELLVVLVQRDGRHRQRRAERLAYLRPGRGYMDALARPARWPLLPDLPDPRGGYCVHRGRAVEPSAVGQFWLKLGRERSIRDRSPGRALCWHGATAEIPLRRSVPDHPLASRQP